MEVQICHQQKLSESNVLIEAEIMVFKYLFSKFTDRLLLKYQVF